MKKTILALDKGIEYLEITVSAVSLACISVLVFLQVILRYVFAAALPWSEEVVTTLVVYMVLFGSARAVRMKEHTEVNGVAKALPKYAGIALRILTNTITLVTLVVMAYASFVLARRINTVTTVFRYRISVNYYGMAIGAALMVYEFVKVLKSRIKGE